MKIQKLAHTPTHTYNTQTLVQNGRGTWQPFGDESKANTLAQYKLYPNMN